MAQIEFDKVSIHYFSFDRGINSFKDMILKGGLVKPFTKYTVLEDIDLKVKQGEVLGILGRNGSGKSSLLKCVAGILRSYNGRISVHGKVAPLLALGSGIEMELTGYENINLVSGLMGVKRKQRKAVTENIRDFSELTDVDLHRHVKTYSTGMIARLSFSIAIAMVPDILLIDEVLAVGDAGFQAKCLARIDEIKKQGTTILFVSHVPGDVKRICSRAICLEDGRLTFDGDVDEALQIYSTYFNT